MEIEQVLQALGTKRVIWIDDRFNQSAELADMILKRLDIAAKSEFPGLREIVEAFRITEDESQLRQWVKDLRPEDEQALKTTLFQAETAEEPAPVEELSPDAVKAACALLKVDPKDQWSFRNAHDSLEQVCKSGDEPVMYIIDLNEYGGSPTEGLTLLEKLHGLQSRGTAFILTHEANVETESDKERELREALKGDGAQTGLGIPVCVISKERLHDDPMALKEALKISLKRAGLRRSVHAVLTHIGPVVTGGFNAAAQMLQEVPPEQLENFAVQRAMSEGVSELHVFERAIGAKISEQIRTSFATGSELKGPTQQLREMRGIELKPDGLKAHPNLAEFRKLEVWESADLLNRAFAPVDSGDIFEIVPADCKNKGTAPKKFILLGQPCDMSIRGDGKRGIGTAYLVPLKVKPEGEAKDKGKEPLLPFQVDGEQWAANFRAASAVNLSILDLAALREDGFVCVDAGQQMPTTLLPGVAAVFEDRVQGPQQLLGGTEKPPSAEDMLKLLLVFGSDDAFKAVRLPTRIDRTKEKPAGPLRVSWALRRVGRVRFPYASSLLRDLFAEMGRDAFDLDFAKALPA